MKKLLLKNKNLILGGFAGVTLSLLLFALINSSFLSLQKKKKPLQVTNFKIEKNQVKKKLKLKKKKKQVKKMDLKPNLKSMLRGMSFGIPALEIDMGSGSDFLNNGNFVDGSKVDQKPKVLYRPDLDFPEEALEKNISGYVVFGIFVDKEGEVKKINLIESEPKGVFDKVALANIKKWKFKAAVHKGISVSTWQEQKITFNSGESS